MSCLIHRVYFGKRKCAHQLDDPTRMESMYYVYATSRNALKQFLLKIIVENPLQKLQRSRKFTVNLAGVRTWCYTLGRMLQLNSSHEQTEQTANDLSYQNYKYV